MLRKKRRFNMSYGVTKTFAIGFSFKTAYLVAIAVITLQPVTLFAEPTQPTNLEISGGTNQPTLSWDASIGLAVSGSEWRGSFGIDQKKWSMRRAHLSVVFNDKMWVMGGVAGSSVLNDVWSSTDGITWTEETANAAWSGRSGQTAAVFNGKMWVMGGYYAGAYSNDVWSSTDGITWTEETANAAWSGRSGHTTAVFNGKLWVMGGYTASGRSNDVWSSTDGITWTEETANAAWSGRNTHATVAFDNKLWVMGGVSISGYFVTDVWSSTDGITWTQEATSTNLPAYGSYRLVEFGNKLWASGGFSTEGRMNGVWSSTDGITWTQETANAAWSKRSDHTFVVFGDRLWVLGGISEVTSIPVNDVWSSTDGITWTEARSSTNWPDRSGHASVVFNDKMWVTGGYGQEGPLNDVWSSTDGITWTEATSSAPWAARLTHTLTVFDNKMWIVGGASGFGGTATQYDDVWYSEDGVSWLRATDHAGWGQLTGPRALSYDGRLWVSGGYNRGASEYMNDVWYSEDGATWTLATGDAPWSGRLEHSFVEFADKMWIMGGETDTTESWLADDIWSSSDGVNWNREIQNAPWGERGYHATTILDGKMWILGGFRGYDWDEVNDVWSSSDGTTWVEDTPSAAWQARDSLTATAFDNRIWVMGGTGDWKLGDVWSTLDYSISHYRLCWDIVQGGCRNTAVTQSTLYTFDQPLAPGTWHFTVYAVNGEGEESVLGASTRLVVPAAAPSVDNAAQPINAGNSASTTPAASDSDEDTDVVDSPGVINTANDEQEPSSERSENTFPLVAAITAAIIGVLWLSYHLVIKRGGRG